MKYMLTSDEKHIANEWQKYQGYTSRPLPNVIHYYRQIILSYSSMHKYLMFGGTPEIRTIFQELNKNIVLFDRSEMMIRAMGRLTHRKQCIADNEYFINMDWLDHHMLDKQFEFIIGDNAINMVNFDHFERFLQNAYRMLVHDGIFLCHLLVKPDNALINKTVADVINEFNQGLIKSKYDLASRLNFICFDNTNYSMGWQQTIETIGKKQLDRFKPTLNFIDTFGCCNSRFYCPPQDIFEKLAEKYFYIDEIFYADEHDYCLFEPVYVLRKKGKNEKINSVYKRQSVSNSTGKAM